MCLVLALTNTKKIKLSACLNDIGNTLLKSEKDGFGYAIQGKSGVFGEKTIARRFRTRLAKTNEVTLPIIKTTYERFGSPSELTGPGIWHGRTATNVISLADTHPMQIEGWNLIHNGVVDDYGSTYKKLTDNDSEDVLRRLIDGVDKTNPMIDIETYLEGYYAFAAIDPQGRLHIARDGIASLHIAWSSKLETFIIATTESLILKVNKILDAKIGPIDEIESEVYCIFNGNDLIHCQDFKSRGYTSRQSSLATASLGRELPPGTQVSGMAPPRVVGPHSAFIEQSTEGAREHRDQLYAKASEADWSDTIVDYLNQQNRHPDRGNSGTMAEESYYQYKREIDNMDASYTIYAADDRALTLEQFKKLDHVAQEMCTIIRSDGTVVDPEDYGTPRLRGRHA